MLRCLVYEVEGDWPRGRPNKTRKEVVDNDFAFACVRLMYYTVKDGGNWWRGKHNAVWMS